MFTGKGEHNLPWNLNLISFAFVYVIALGRTAHDGSTLEYIFLIK